MWEVRTYNLMLLSGPQHYCNFFYFAVVSLLGVVLIARPTALFGPESHAMAMTDDMMANGMMMAEKGTSGDRLLAVWYVPFFYYALKHVS